MLRSVNAATPTHSTNTSRSSTANWKSLPAASMMLATRLSGQVITNLLSPAITRTHLALVWKILFVPSFTFLGPKLKHRSVLIGTLTLVGCRRTKTLSKRNALSIQHNCFAVIKQITGFVEHGVSVLLAFRLGRLHPNPWYQRLVARRIRLYR